MKKLGMLMALLATSAIAMAAEPQRLTIAEGWARPTPPGASVAAAYVVINNASKRSERLLAISSARAGSVSVHRTVIENDIASMRAVPLLHLAAGERVVMAPGGLHLMLMQLQAPLQAGEEFTLKFKFELHGEMQVKVRVADTTDAPGHQH